MNQMVNLVNEYEERLTLLERTYSILDSIGLLNLMIDYNLTWNGVYEIVKEAIEESVEE